MPRTHGSILAVASWAVALITFGATWYLRRATRRRYEIPVRVVSAHLHRHGMSARCMPLCSIVRKGEVLERYAHALPKLGQAATLD
jgi:hypothetical protein